MLELENTGGGLTLSRRNMATPQTRFQPMMARAPMAFHASPVSAAQLPVYTRPAQSQ